MWPACLIPVNSVWKYSCLISLPVSELERIKMDFPRQVNILIYPPSQKNKLFLGLDSLNLILHCQWKSLCSTHCLVISHLVVDIVSEYPTVDDSRLLENPIVFNLQCFRMRIIKIKKTNQLKHKDLGTKSIQSQYSIHMNHCTTWKAT